MAGAGGGLRSIKGTRRTLWLPETSHKSAQKLVLNSPEGSLSRFLGRSTTK